MSETKLDFDQVDVFGSARYLGNPLAVVHEAVDFSTEEMARFARTIVHFRDGSVERIEGRYPAREPLA